MGGEVRAGRGSISPRCAAPPGAGNTIPAAKPRSVVMPEVRSVVISEVSSEVMSEAHCVVPEAWRLEAV